MKSEMTNLESNGANDFKRAKSARPSKERALRIQNTNSVQEKPSQSAISNEIGEKNIGQGSLDVTNVNNNSGWSDNPANPNSKQSKIRVVENLESSNDVIGLKDIPTFDDGEQQQQQQLLQASPQLQGNDGLEAKISLGNKDDLLAAAPPNLKINRYKTILEIDNELKAMQASSIFHGKPDSALLSNVNLSPLIGNIHTEQLLQQEDDIEWTWDRTFPTICARISEIEKQSGL